MFSYPNSKQFDTPPEDSDKSAKSVRTNVFLVFLVIIFTVCFCIWTFSDISGVYVVKSGNMSSPVTLTIMRKAAGLEGSLSVQQAGLFSLGQSSYKDENLILVFNPVETNKRAIRANAEITIEGKLVDGKIKGLMTSTIGRGSIPIVLERDAGTSLHTMVQSHMPTIPKLF